MTRIRGMLAFAVVAVLAIAPGPAGAEVGSGLPGVSLLVRVLTPQPSKPAPAPVVKHAVAPKPVEEAQAKTAGVVDVIDATDPTADLVRIVQVFRVEAKDSKKVDRGTPCPRSDTCTAHQLMTGRWKTDKTGRVVVPFKYNDGRRRNMRAPDVATVRSAFARAGAEWSRWNSNIAFKDTGTSTASFAATGKDGSCDDGTNVVTWTSFDPGVVGAASTCYDRANRYVRDVDLALNNSQRWTNGKGDPRRPSYDVQAIFTHELGHWLSLRDLYSENDASRQTMYGATDTNEAFKRTLGRGDIRGVQRAYPCGAGDTCPSKNIVDD